MAKVLTNRSQVNGSELKYQNDRPRVAQMHYAA